MSSKSLGFIKKCRQSLKTPQLGGDIITNMEKINMGHCFIVNQVLSYI